MHMKATYNIAVGIALRELQEERHVDREKLANALETQQETDPPLQESASLAEVLSAAKLILQYSQSGNPLDASEYPLLQRLGIADHGEISVTLDEHADAIDEIRQGLRG